MNLLKKYYSMSTLEKLDKVDLQILSITFHLNYKGLLLVVILQFLVISVQTIQFTQYGGSILWIIII